MSLISCTTRQIVLAQEYLIFTIEHYNLSNTPAEQWFFFNAVSFAIDCHQISHRTPESMHLILLFAKHKSWITVGYKMWLYSVFFYKPLTSNYKLKYVCMQIKKVKGLWWVRWDFHSSSSLCWMDQWYPDGWRERPTEKERKGHRHRRRMRGKIKGLAQQVISDDVWTAIPKHFILNP